MANSEEGKPSKIEKPSSPIPDQANMHVYPDWAAMQAYYGPRVAVPPYFNSAVPPGHAPHPYMWGPPQAMMPPYGAPFAAIYAHGGVYAHPGVPLAPTPLNTETPGKSAGNTDRGLMKKLKEFDGLAMSIGNGNVDSADGGAEHGDSRSGETEGSSDGSDGNTARAGQNIKKRSREGTPTLSGDGKIEIQKNLVSLENGSSDKMRGATVTAATVAGKVVGSVLSPKMTTALELRNPSPDPSNNRSSVPPGAMIPENWIQNERELKRERRKQSNRESARRSRLRKQAETEELGIRVEALIAENTTLKSELSRLTENSEKLKLENASLMEKLKNAQMRQPGNGISVKVDTKGGVPVSTENLLSRVNNSGSVDRVEEENESYGGNKKSGAKLHQLLGASPRTDAVAAS